MLKRPPQHRADAPILFIHESDDWDHDRIARERKEAPDERHPFDRYQAGETRYDLDAAMTYRGQAVTVRQYLREGAEPTVFRLRRVSGDDRYRLIATGAQLDPTTSSRDEHSALWALCRLGLVEVTDGFNGPAWDLHRTANGLTEAAVQTLYDVRPRLPIDIGWAVFHAAAPLSEAEGKR